jgi:ubiquinol-cytochrome c reductase cytochrome c1 subunit
MKTRITGSEAWDFTEISNTDFLATNSLHPTAYPWEHSKWTKTFDHAA